MEDGACTDNFEIFVGGQGPIFAYTSQNDGSVPNVVVSHEVLVPAQLLDQSVTTITFQNTSTDDCGLAAVFNVALSPDSDGDGIPDAEDACPSHPEDFDGFLDSDGCPEATYIASGDSISAGDDIDGEKNNKWEAYPRHVLRYLQSQTGGNYNFAYLDECNQGETGDAKYNTSHGGDATSDYLATQLQKVLDCEPDLISVTIGANDVQAHFLGCLQQSLDTFESVLDVPFIEHVPPEYVIAAALLAAEAAVAGCIAGVSEELETILGTLDLGIDGILNSLANDASSVTLATNYYNPWSSDGLLGSLVSLLGAEEYVGAINGTIALHVGEHATSTGLVDLRTAFNHSSDVRGHEFLSDCSYIELALPPVHPNKAGQEVIASQLVREARRLGFIPEGSPSSPFVACTTPSVGPAGTSITIHGADFMEGAAVTFGGEEAEVVNVSSDGTHVVVTAPDHPDGVVHVELTNPDGASSSLLSGYDFGPLPAPILERFLHFLMGSPATMMVTDPLGRRTGTDPATGEVVLEIPTADYVPGDGVESGSVVAIADPIEGEYQVEVAGTGTGSYNLSAISTVDNVVTAEMHSIDVPITEGEIHTEVVDVLPVLCGDQNLDGAVNVFDAIIDLQIIVGLTEPSDGQMILGDVVRDGMINVFDVILLLQHIVGLTEIRECGPPA